MQDRKLKLFFRSNLKRPLTCSRVFFYILAKGGLNACLKVAGRCVAQRHTVATLHSPPRANEIWPLELWIHIATAIFK